MLQSAIVDSTSCATSLHWVSKAVPATRIYKRRYVSSKKENLSSSEVLFGKHWSRLLKKYVK